MRETMVKKKSAVAEKAAPPMQSDMMRRKGMLTPKEAAERAGVRPVSIYRIAERAGVKSERAGGRLYLDARDLAAKGFGESPTIQAEILRDLPAPPRPTKSSRG